jgi:hypothetical protein
MDEKEIRAFTKRLETVQNMTDTSGVKELCEILMELLELKEKTPLGFTAKEEK